MLNFLSIWFYLSYHLINTNEKNDIKEPLQKSINKATINEITDEDNNNKAKENKEIL